MYQAFFEICMACLYTSSAYFLQIKIKSQFRSQSYEPLLKGVSAYLEHVANYVAVFSERGGHMF